VPRVRDADGTAGPVVPERLVAAVPGPVVVLLEHDAEAGGEPQHEVLADRLDLGDFRDRGVGEQPGGPVDLAEAHRVQPGEPAGRADAARGRLAAGAEGADVRQRLGAARPGDVERHAEEAVGRGRLVSLFFLLRRWADREQHAYPVVNLRGRADVEVDAARVADLLPEELRDGHAGDAPDELVHDRADRQPVIPVRLARPPVRNLRREPGRHPVVIHDLFER
jgi:hypothetical protein